MVDAKEGITGMDTTILDEAGLNMVAVFNVSDLPDPLLSSLSSEMEEIDQFQQLLLIGHGGRQMWASVMASPQRDDSNPIDVSSLEVVKRFLEETADCSYQILYPGGPSTLPIQQLGALAGWHHPSPFMVGINQNWGTWFAYRAVVLATTKFPATVRDTQESPCPSCPLKPCIAVCPATAITASDFDLGRCVAYRQEDQSQCAHQCLARQACPVAPQHRYSDEQIHYHYERSLETIRESFGHHEKYEIPGRSALLQHPRRHED